MKLTKSSDLATEWDMDEAELKRRVRRYGWPCVRLSRTDVRFTDQQIEQIVAMSSRAAVTKTANEKPRTGQSKKSRGRAS
jgi:hypothetical protein